MGQAILQSNSIVETSLTISRMAEIIQNPNIMSFKNEETRASVIADLQSMGH
jgi:hypothetical protein